jgi:hypothetical protein
MLNADVVMDRQVIRKMGIEALMKSLGPIGMVEFMHEFDSGYGDYTNERHNWLDNLSINEICDEINTAKKEV